MSAAYSWTEPTTHGELTIAQLAEQAAESIRALNHLTLPGGALSDPADACEVVASLARATGRAPQLLGQLSRWLGSEHRAGQMRLDAWSPMADVSEAVTAAVVALTKAAQAACQAGARSMPPTSHSPTWPPRSARGTTRLRMQVTNR